MKCSKCGEEFETLMEKRARSQKCICCTLLPTSTCDPDTCNMGYGEGQVHGP